MIITPANLNLFFTALENGFWTAYSNAPKWSDKVATTYSVATEQWASGWMGQLDTMKEWLGDRPIQTPGLQTYVVPIQNFVQTKSVDMFKLQDDQEGLYAPTVAFMGMNSAKLADYQIRDLLLNQNSQVGARQIGLDGLSHWNIAHPVNFYDASYGTYCNDFTGGVSVNSVTVGGALGVTAYATLWQEFASRKAENGEALGVIPNMTMVPPQLNQTAMVIIQGDYFAAPTLGNLTGQVGAAQNVLKGSTELMMNPDLAAAPTVWYMLCTDKPIKPFSWLQRQAPDFTYRNQPQDPSVFDLHNYLYGSVARGAPAWSFAWLSAKSAP